MMMSVHQCLLRANELERRGRQVICPDDAKIFMEAAQRWRTLAAKTEESALQSWRGGAARH